MRPNFPGRFRCCRRPATYSEQSAALRAEAVNLKSDLADGNYRVGFQRAVELGLLLSGSESAKEASERVAKMQGGPMPAALKAPASTASLVPVADRLIQAIDAGDHATAKEQISGLTKSIGDVYRAEAKRAPATPMSTGDPAQGGGATDGKIDEIRELQVYFDLTKSLHDALSKNSIDESVALATKMQSAIAERLARPSRVPLVPFLGRNLYQINDAFGRAALAVGTTKQRGITCLSKQMCPWRGEVLCVALARTFGWPRHY